MCKKQSTYIKLIAILTMFIDHLGLLVFPEYIFLRIIGRIAFPLFAYQIGISCLNTSNPRKYIFRIATFALVLHALEAVISPYFPSYNLNIFFTLAIGALAIITFLNKHYFLSLSILFILPYLLEQLLNRSLDYGMYGVLLIFFSFLARKNIPMLITTFILLNAYFIMTGGSYLQAYSLLALVFILRPFSLNFTIPSIAFYLFYPLHFVLLALLAMLRH